MSTLTLVSTKLKKSQYLPTLGVERVHINTTVFNLLPFSTFQTCQQHNIVFFSCNNLSITTIQFSIKHFVNTKCVVYSSSTNIKPRLKNLIKLKSIIFANNRCLTFIHERCKFLTIKCKRLSSRIKIIWETEKRNFGLLLNNL